MEQAHIANQFRVPVGVTENKLEKIKKMKKYQVINKLTGAILKETDSEEEASQAALSESKFDRKSAILIVESQTNNVIKEFGLLLD